MKDGPGGGASRGPGQKVVCLLTDSSSDSVDFLPKLIIPRDWEGMRTIVQAVSLGGRQGFMNLSSEGSENLPINVLRSNLVQRSLNVVFHTASASISMLMAERGCSSSLH